MYWIPEEETVTVSLVFFNALLYSAAKNLYFNFSTAILKVLIVIKIYRKFRKFNYFKKNLVVHFVLHKYIFILILNDKIKYTVQIAMSIIAWYFGNPYCCVFSCLYKKVKQIIKILLCLYQDKEQKTKAKRKCI